LAFLASWREQIPVLDSHGPPENLRKVRKLLCIAVQKAQKNVGAGFKPARLRDLRGEECPSKLNERKSKK